MKENLALKGKIVVASTQNKFREEYEKAMKQNKKLLIRLEELEKNEEERK